MFAGLYLESIQVESSIVWILKMQLTLWVVCVQEAYGKFLDMHELYNRFLNSKFGHPIEYSAFLEEFYQTHQIARHHKLTKYALLSLLPMAHASVSWGGTSSLGISIYNLQEL